MPDQSRFSIELPETDILTWLFSTPSESNKPWSSPQWISAEKPDTVSLSLDQALLWIRKLGLGVKNLGLKEGEVVLIYSTNHIFMPVAYLGASGYGYVFSGVNPAYGVAETKFQIENTGAKLFLVEPTLLDTALAAAEKAKFPKERIFLFSDEQCQTTQGVRDWRSMLPSDDEAKNYQWKTLSPEEARTRTAVLNYSSGTTGLPKGVMISHRNVVSNTEQSLFMRSLSAADASTLRKPFAAPDERWLGFLPLYHAYGQLWTIAAAARCQTPVYFLRAFEYRNWLQNLQTHRITHIQTAPPILVMLGKRPETKEYDLSALRNILCGAAPLSAELQNEVMKKVGTDLKIVQTCGATEATCSGFWVPGLMQDLSGSIGVIGPGCEIKLVSDDGKEVGDNERGEIYYRGPNVALGYWKNEQATKDSFTKDGYWKSGDIAVKKEGWYWIVDRKKELIKVKGFQVAPAELEAALLEHDDIADAAVVALHVDHEERPRAYISLKEHAQGKLKEDDIVKWIAQRVAKHKQLTGGVKFVKEVPKSPSGKIQRVIMRDWAKKDAEALKNGKAKL